MLESNVTKVDFNEAIEEIEECSSGFDNGYYVEINEFNNTIEIITSEQRDFSSCKSLYSFVKEELSDKVKSVTLFRMIDGVRKNNYTKTFATDSYHCETLFQIINETIDQIEILKSYMDSINVQQSLADKSIDILEHSIECSGFLSDEEIKKQFIKFKATLRKRREIKNTLYISEQIKSNKILTNLYKINIKSERTKVNNLRGKLRDKREKGKEKWMNTDEKINIIKFSNNIEKERAYNELSNRFNSVKIDEFNNIAAGYDLIYR